MDHLSVLKSPNVKSIRSFQFGGIRELISFPFSKPLGKQKIELLHSLLPSIVVYPDEIVLYTNRIRLL
jgi:hypothetical protein